MDFCDYCSEPISNFDKSVEEFGVFHRSKGCGSEYLEKTDDKKVLKIS